MAPTPVESSEQIEHAASLWAVKDYPLSPEDEAALRDWLAGDPRRRGALLRAQAGWHALSRARALGPSAGWPGASRLPLPNLSRRRLFAAAGGFGLVAASVLAVVGQRTHETMTHTGEIRRLPMSDGSIAAMNTESRLRIDMAEAERRIELVKGEAWFKVAKNKDRPFIVAAGTARVKAVGTAFSVKRLEDGVEVLVTEGTVMAWSTQDGDARAVTLNAGDRTLISDHKPVEIRHAPDDIDDDLAWREGQIALNGKSLSEVAGEFNRYNRIKIVIQDDTLAKERLIGRLSANDPEAFSSAIVQAYGVEVSRTDKIILIGTKK
ncbi:MAG: iron dicitrate transport regulator FecR [Asticcacaulis sp. 32-58-5]|nr:MAG: iron dicitrate transport regulator FecR [Asticcacaulis sp. 32-58-5]